MRRTLFRLAPHSLPSARAHTRSATAAATAPVPWDDPTAEIKPGEHVVAVGRQHSIAFPDKLRRLQGLDIRGDKNKYKLGVFVSQQHCFAHNSMKYFDVVEHPFAKTLLDIYVEKKKEPLWIYSVAYGQAAFVSKKAAKKITHALRDALVAAGYDRFGRRVLAEGESSAVADLHGTLRIVGTDPIAVCDAKFVDLLATAKEIIGRAETILRRDKNGRHMAQHLANKQQQKRPAYDTRHSQRPSQKQNPKRDPKRDPKWDQKREPSNRGSQRRA